MATRSIAANFMNHRILGLVVRVGLLGALLVPTVASGQTARADARVVTRSSPDARLAITRDELVGKRRFVLKGWTGDLADATITDLAGNEISETLAPKTESAGVTMAQPTQPFIVKTRTLRTIRLNHQGETSLPGGLVMAVSAPGDGGGAAAVWFRLFCWISPSPAPWDESGSSYVTQMKFTVRPTEGAPASVSLPHPVAISLDFDGMTGPAVPPFTIEQAGLEHEKVVELRFRPSTMQPKLKVRSTISDSDVLVEALPRLELRPARTVLLGFGLETVAVTVAQIRADGQPAEATAPANVDLQVRGTARPEPAGAVVIPTGGSRAEFVLRTSGLGKVTVHATVGALSATTELNQRFPWGPLLAALIGGALGGLARRWAKGARKRHAVRNVFEGAVVALIAFVAAVLGVGYLHLPSALAATEAGAFLTGALWGFVGVTFLSMMTKPSLTAAGR